MAGDWDKLDDAALISALQKGRLSAFTQLVERHQRSLINFFYHLSWDRQVAEDCAQEVFLRLHAHLGSYEPQAKFTTFLYRIARNLWIMDARAPRAAEAGVAGGRSASGGTPWEPGFGPVAPPVEIWPGRNRQALRDAIERLLRNKSVLILSEMQGLKYRNRAVLDIPWAE
jgi:RNA polymerase sigma-70 factor (ECF subfamily)